MGKRGPAPKPTRLKILQGNPGKRRLNTDEPQPQLGSPKMPSWLSAEAQTEWRNVLPELERLKLLTVIDGSVLAAYCQAFAELVIATEMLNEHGRLISEPVLDRAGNHVGNRERTNPAVRLQRDAFARVKQFAAEFGLSPAMRPRLATSTNGADEDPLADIIARSKRSSA